MALIGEIRVKEFSKNGESYKWVLQIRDVNDHWSDIETTSVLKMNFEKEDNIKYYQNNLMLTKHN